MKRSFIVHCCTRVSFAPLSCCRSSLVCTDPVHTVHHYDTFDNQNPSHCFQKRIDIAREDWFQSLDSSSRTEVDRALATARQAWAAEYEDEMEDRVNAEVERARENLMIEMEEFKQKEIDQAVWNFKKQFENTERKLKDELSRLKVD